MAVALSAAAPAAAVLWTDRPATFADVIARADRVYRGRVESLSYGSSSGPAGQSLPYMQIGLRVERAYQDTSAGTRESVYVLGGRLASASGRRLLIPGLAILRSASAPSSSRTMRAFPTRSRTPGNPSQSRARHSRPAPRFAA
jgi:hypothetical protein